VFLAAERLSKNPLLIALAVALLGNFLIPRILDRAETNRRALDLKANLATQMGGSFEAVLTQGDLFARGVMKKTSVNPQIAFNDAWSEWRTAGAEVDAQLTAYFPGDNEAGEPFTERWRKFRKAVDAMYFLSGTGLKDARCKLIKDVKAVLEASTDARACREEKLGDLGYQKRVCLAKHAKTYDLLAACDSDSKEVYGYRRGSEFSRTYTSVTETLLSHGRSLVRELLTLTPSGF